MKEAIRHRALDLGFDACRFTTAEAPDNAAQFSAWIAQGRHGEMAYLQRNVQKRIDPRKVLPGAKSILCLAVSYVHQRRASSVERRETEIPHSAFRTPRLTGVVARYARFDDYHDVLGERLKTLTDFVNELGGSNMRSLWYVDTGPLLERDLAQRAGLGFIGKHTNLISRQLGNWILLAEMITTLELEPDPPEINRCGTCARCIAACPTGAITGPFQLDARLCISYLTIELKGAIPVELRAAVGNRIFGCDDCLAVCPWNRFAREGHMMKDHARQDLEQPDLLDLLSLDEAGFKRRFANTPLWRTKRRGLLRNVCVALGNVADESAVPALQRAAGDPEPLIAEHARWAIEQIRKRSQGVGPAQPHIDEVETG
jgi:epoxyqueuosine reductase